MIFQSEEDASASPLPLTDGYSNFSGYLDQISFQLTPNHTKPWAPGPEVPIHLFSGTRCAHGLGWRRRTLTQQKLKASGWYTPIKEEHESDFRWAEGGNERTALLWLYMTFSKWRQATTPTQRNDSEVITNKQKQWTVQDSQLFRLKSRHGCHCSQKYPPLNLNKLHLQCPRREKRTRPGYGARASHGEKQARIPSTN